MGLSNYAAKDYDAASISYPAASISTMLLNNHAAGDCAAKYKAAAIIYLVYILVN